MGTFLSPKPRKLARPENCFHQCSILECQLGSAHEVDGDDMGELRNIAGAPLSAAWSSERLFWTVCKMTQKIKIFAKELKSGAWVHEGEKSPSDLVVFERRSKSDERGRFSGYPLSSGASR